MKSINILAAAVAALLVPAQGYAQPTFNVAAFNYQAPPTGWMIHEPSNFGAWVRVCGAVDTLDGYVCVVENGHAVIKPVDSAEQQFTVPTDLDDLQKRMCKLGYGYSCFVRSIQPESMPNGWQVGSPLNSGAEYL